MKCDISLQDVMNTVSGYLETCLAAPEKYLTPSVDETGILAKFDPLLARLRKEYLDAQTNRLQIEKDFGREDGMAAIAADMEDSAWCAMQTRLIELRADAQAVEFLTLARKEARAVEESRMRQEKEKEALARFYYLQMLMSQKREKTRDDTAFWILLLVLYGRGGFIAAPVFRPAPAMVFARAA